MNIVHQVTFRTADGVEPDLQKLGLEYRLSRRSTGNHVLYLEMYESDPRWPIVQELMGDERLKRHFTYNTVYSEEEIRAADWNRLLVSFEQGYPQPESRWNERNPPNYSQFCSTCGTFRQIAPYYLAREPRLKNSQFLQLFWVPAKFATPIVFETFELENVTGYERWEALIYQTMQPSTVVSQLYVTETAEPGLVNTEDMTARYCEECGVTKYLWGFEKTTMKLRRGALLSDVDIVHTYEWFGSEGWYAYREVLVSNRVAQLILDQGWLGVQLKVVELV